MSDTHISRSIHIRVFFVLVGMLLAARALYLQVIDNTYRIKAEATAIQKYTVYPSRGLVYDRNGKLLVYNEPVHDLMVTYNQLNPKMDTTKFCQLLGITKEEFIKRLDKDFRRDFRYSTRKPFVFLDKIPPERFARFQESLYQFPGFSVQVRNIRGYPHQSAAHLLGYIREVNQEEVNSSDGAYVSGDYVGGVGLEKTYEAELRGVKGARYVLKDNLGRDVGPYNEGALDSIPISGKDLIASIDLDLQRYGEQLMKNKTGAVVALDPKTGEVLSMISAPDYNPSGMSITRDRGAIYQALLNDPKKPLYNRPVQAQYPPGSTFKSVVALIALQEGLISNDRYISCRGAYYYNNERRKCRNHPSPVNVTGALKWSCNTFFFTVFREIIDKENFYKPRVGLEIFDEYCYNFGLGKELGIDFPIEEDGNIPTSATYDRMYPNGGWKSPTIMSLGIGQGEIQLTTLQMANLAAIIANKGFYVTPHLVRGFREEENLLIPEQYRTFKEVSVDARHFEPIIEGMRQVVDSGTARGAKIPGISVGGKTGTVQNPQGEDHSTFIAFAPAENPQIAIAVYVENAGGGGRFAAPIASLMIEKYLNGSIENPRRKYQEKQMLETNLNDTP